MKNEVAAFIEDAERKMLEVEMRDVYVTDHKHKAAKYSTLSAEEDLEYYNYTKAVEDYNKQSMRSERPGRFESGRFERGSLKQRIFEPLADAVKLDNGTMFMELTDKDIASEVNESTLRA